MYSIITKHLLYICIINISEIYNSRKKEVFNESYRIVTVKM